MNNAEDIWRERDALRRQYGTAYEQMNNILFAEDPARINFGYPTDEYEPEVCTILPRLHDCRSVDDVRRVVHEEFIKWFHVDIPGSTNPPDPPEMYDAVAKRIWDEVVPGLPD